MPIKFQYLNRSPVSVIKGAVCSIIRLCHFDASVRFDRYKFRVPNRLKLSTASVKLILARHTLILNSGVKSLRIERHPHEQFLLERRLIICDGGMCEFAD